MIVYNLLGSQFAVNPQSFCSSPPPFPRWFLDVWGTFKTMSYWNRRYLWAMPRDPRYEWPLDLHWTLHWSPVRMSCEPMVLKLGSSGLIGCSHAVFMSTPWLTLSLSAWVSVDSLPTLVQAIYSAAWAVGSLFSCSHSWIMESPSRYF